MTTSNMGQSGTWRVSVTARVAVVLVAIHGGMLGWISAVNSPNLDEPAHLMAGVSHWKSGRFVLYRVNPPLVRMVAAIPTLMTDVPSDGVAWNVADLYSRPEFIIGSQFVKNERMAQRYIMLARWACVPLCLVGPWIVFLWARNLYGPAAGLTALCLYCFCPNCIAWGASITPDAVGASFGVMAAYLFWKWLEEPTWNRSLWAGLGLGLAELTKGTWIVLFFVFPLVWLIHSLASFVQCKQTRPQDTPPSDSIEHVKPITSRVTQFWQLTLILSGGLYLLNLGFAFEGSFKPLREYRFISRTLSGQDEPPSGANRFAQTWLGALPVPLPENYVRGLDVQKFDFEEKRWSYLCGEQRRGGWWYYYLFAFLVKTPLGTLILCATATILSIFNRNYRSSWHSELMVLLPAIVVLTLVSSQTGFSRYLRYALPILPFAYIHAGRVAMAFVHSGRLLSATVILGCSMAAIESLAVFPHSMSFFNWGAGGPLNGHKFLLDANIDWGQDLLFLKQWYDAHPDARPFHAAYFDEYLLSSEAAGIASIPVPGFLSSTDRGSLSEDLQGPQPGWYAISVNHLKGYRHYDSDVPKYVYWQRVQPVARAGYSIYIYHLNSDQASELRRQLGLNQLRPVN
eukprot:TRINITY_DN65_c0_g1_i1.p1 TRINITY_DN65_c0_g1~~TRINITY_DN65_c0_g1_i1.p1  ORF type:complete len:627 (-),score=75.43 TRINITY_DN65_c0_g1_i1:2059-3939(-)